MKQEQEEQEKNSKIAVKIGRALYEDLEKQVKGSGFSSVDDYVTYLLSIHIGKKSEEGELSSEDAEVVTSRLKALGYI